LPYESLETSAPLTTKNAYAIVIGISDYPESDNDLAYCDDDSQDVYSILINEYNFKEENIFYLQDSSATKAQINAAFNSINAQITENDVFFFYYSGHGGANLVNDGIHMHSIDSPHPYSNYYDNTWSIYHPNAAYIRVYFDHFDTEYDYDWVYLGDSDIAYGYAYEGYSGYSTGFWSGWIPLLDDNSIYIRFISDYSVTEWGFSIDRYEVMKYDGTHYLCSYDSIPSTPSNYYLDSLINSKLDAMNAAEKYVITDACNSGGIIPEVQDVGRYIMTACADEEFSLEDPTLQHGVFTNYFLESISLATDTNGDGVRSMEECYSYIYSNTVSFSGSLGYTHHPQEYDGISGESVLSTAFGALSLVPTGNSLSYSFNMYGIGLIEDLILVVYNNSLGMDYEVLDLTLTPTSDTGFGNYSGVLQLNGFSGLTGYGIYAKVSNNRVISLNETYAEDADSDSLDDALEIMMGSNPLINDTDNDGISDGYEYSLGLDPCLNDTDSDGLLDGDELLVYLTDATDDDTDNDQLTDYEEIMTYLTNATNSDTEGDGMNDGYEINYDLDPFTDDASSDYDNDGVNNLIECQLGCYANDPDTDDDNMPDGYEYNHELNVFADDSNLDYDSDGLNNLLEYQLGSYADDTDSDHDFLPDFWEYTYGLEIMGNDAYDDEDNDGLDNIEEYVQTTNPIDVDTDNDGLSDGIEVNTYLTDPTDPDTDGDGYSDGLEITWGTNPLDPRISITTVFLNIIGVIVIATTGSTAVYTQVIKRKHRKDKKKVIDKFPIMRDHESYNILRVKKTAKPKPKISPYTYKPIYTPSKPIYTTPSQPSTPIGQMDINKIRDSILYGMPPPKTNYSEEGRKALLIANMAFELINKGDFKKGFDYMISALVLGVPEPMNSRIKKILLDSLYRGAGMSGSGPEQLPPSKKRCDWCGSLNQNTANFCYNCGREI
ncbi:MAG: caspase family protein, partial [Candidatus Thorarchaeota archaeon]